MTPTEEARRVAEIAEYEIQERLSDNRSVYCHADGTAWRFNPRHDANQAIEALNRVFPDGWECEFAPANTPERRYLIWPTWSEPGRDCGGAGPTFGAAAVAVILAAGGKK